MIDSEAAPLTIEDLVTEFARTDNPATLDRLLEVSQPWVWSIVERVDNPVPGVISTDDLFQVGLLTMVACARRFRDEHDETHRIETFRGWAYRKIRGAAIDLTRQLSSTSRARNVPMVPLPESEELLPVGTTWVEQFDEVLPSQVLLNLREAMGLLTLRQATILLFLFNGLTVARLATILELSPSRVAQERDAAFKILRPALTGHLGT